MTANMLQHERVSRAHRWLVNRGHHVTFDQVGMEWIKRFAVKWRSRFTRKQSS